MGLLSFLKPNIQEQVMSCPRGHGALVREDVFQIRMYHCAACDGRWLPGKDIHDFFIQLADPAQALEDFSHQLNQHGQPSSARCADDGAEMQCITQRGVTLDVCTKCKGIWFDGGELNQCFAASAAAQPPGTASPSKTAEVVGTAALAVGAAEVAAGLFDLFN